MMPPSAVTQMPQSAIVCYYQLYTLTCIGCFSQLLSFVVCCLQLPAVTLQSAVLYVPRCWSCIVMRINMIIRVNHNQITIKTPSPKSGGFSYKFTFARIYRPSFRENRVYKLGHCKGTWWQVFFCLRPPDGVVSKFCRFGIWSNTQWITPVYALHTTRSPPPRYTLYKYVDTHVLIHTGKGGRGGEPVRMSEGR